MAGLTGQGLTIKRLPEIISDIVETERNEINQDISVSDDEFLGQLNTIFAAAIADQWELAQVVKDAFNLNRAEGQSLDDLGAIIGVSRQQPLPSSGYQRVIATNGTTLASGFVFENPVSNDRFLSLASATLTTANCYAATYSVTTLLNSTSYVLAVNDVQYTYTSDSSATALEILNGLAALITADVNATYTATVSAPDLTMRIVTDTAENIAVSSVTYISPVSVELNIFIQSVANGPIPAPANSIIKTISVVSGLISTTNPAAFSIGRVIETDEEYRVRLKASRSNNGRSTLEAIKVALLRVDGVTSAVIYENEEITTDLAGRPAKSFEAVVVGGDDPAVALAIWENKPAGIKTHGNTMEIVPDSALLEHNVYFTRTEEVHLALRITYTLYDEEVFPDTGEDLIVEQALAIVNALSPNEDFIPTRLFGPIYSNVPGIDSLLVEVQTIASPTTTPSGGSWQTDRISIDFDEVARTTIDDVYIVAA